MDEVFRFLVEQVVGRLVGAMNFRFVLQPIVAITLGILEGRRDAKAGIPPFIYDLVAKPADRPRAIKSAGHQLLVPVAIGTVLDAVAQDFIFGQVYPVAALLVGASVMGIPYALARGVCNRIVTDMGKRPDVVKHE